MSKQKWIRILAGIVLVLELVGTAISLRNGGIGNLIYYTVDSNILTLASCAGILWHAWKTRGKQADAEGEPSNAFPAWLRFLRFLAAIQLALTFLIVVCVFVPMAYPYGTVPDILYRGPQIYHHLLCPVLTVLSFLLLERGYGFTRRENLLAVLPTLGYAILVTLLNALRIVDGPYPFFQVYNQPIWASVLWFIGINAFVYGIAALLRRANGAG